VHAASLPHSAYAPCLALHTIPPCCFPRTTYLCLSAVRGLVVCNLACIMALNATCSSLNRRRTSDLCFALEEDLSRTVVALPYSWVNTRLRRLHVCHERLLVLQYRDACGDYGFGSCAPVRFISAVPICPDGLYWLRTRNDSAFTAGWTAPRIRSIRLLPRTRMRARAANSWVLFAPGHETPCSAVFYFTQPYTALVLLRFPTVPPCPYLAVTAM